MTWYKSDLHNPTNVTRRMLRQLTNDLDLLINDFILAEEGFTFKWAIDYSELFRYLHPILDLLRFPARNRPLYVSKQMGIRFLMDFNQGSKLILPSTLEEYRHDARRISDRVANLEIEEIDDYEQWAAQYSSPFDRLHGLVSEILLTVSDSTKPEMRRAISNAIKAKLVEEEYENGASIFNKYVGDGQIAFLPDSIRSTLEQNPNFNMIINEKTRQIGRFRSEKPLSNLRDAQNIAYLSLLNADAREAKHLFVMLSDASYVRDIEMACELTNPVGSYLNMEGLFPLLRSIDYWLLRTFFLSQSDNDPSQALKLARAFSSVAARGVSGYTHKAGNDSSLDKDIQDVIKDLCELYSWEFLSEALRARFDKILGTEKTGDVTISRERLSMVFSEFSTQPKLVFQQYVSLGKVMSKVSDKIDESFHAKLYSKIGLRGLGKVYGIYPEELYDIADLKIRDELNESFAILANRDTTEDELELLRKKAPKLLRENPSSPALCVAHSICLRRFGLHDWSARELVRADRLSPENPEVILNQCILLRVRADEGELPNYMRQQLLKKAAERSNALIEIERIQPRYWQFAAYMIWRISRIENPNLDTKPSQEDQAAMELAANYCKNALEYLDREHKPASENILQMQLKMSLINDCAYYYALTGFEEKIATAHKLISSISSEDHTRNSLDTLGFVTIQRFAVAPSPDRLEILREAILTYKTAFDMDKMTSISREHLSIAVNLYLGHGGILS